MSNIILKVENLSKQYRLGQVGAGTIGDDLKRWWFKLRRREDPFLKIGDENNRSSKANSDYVWALKDIDFEVKQGEVLGIIGKNGAGKSTLLKILSKITSPTTGIIKSKGTVASLLEVGTGFHSELTGRENIYLNGAILGMTKVEISSKIDEIINFSGCERYIDTPVKRYSSGMTVRLAFAVAAFLEPEILIIDEVLAVGDAEFQKKAIGKMQDISKGDGRTVLFVSHNMGAVRSLCTRVIVLDKGKIGFVGRTKEAIDYYLSSDNNMLKIPFRDREDRIGSGLAKLKDVYIEKNFFYTGAPFKVKILYENDSDFKITEFGVSIWNKDEIKIISVSSTFKNQIGIMNDKEGVVVCEIDELPLVKGSYVLNAFISIEEGLADYIEKIVEFEVEDCNYYRTGKTVNPSWGLIVVDHNWKKE